MRIGKASGLIALTGLALGGAPTRAPASSHREAPLITTDHPEAAHRMQNSTTGWVNPYSQTGRQTADITYFDLAGNSLQGAINLEPRLSMSRFGGRSALTERWPLPASSTVITLVGARRCSRLSWRECYTLELDNHRMAGDEGLR